MAQQLRAMDALQEDQDAIPGTHMVAQRDGEEGPTKACL